MLLEIEHLTKTYQSGGQSIRAVDDVSLRLLAGEFVAVRGKSGCGKSTVLLSAGGLLRPDSGVVRVQGQDIYRMPRQARGNYLAQQIGFVFQQFHLIPYLTVEENILAPRLALASTSSHEDGQRVAQLLEQLGLCHRRRHRPDQLSVGERQRVALARALINQPSVILADEPTGNLDPENGQIVLTHLRRFADAGHGVFMVTHQTIQDVRIDRQVVMQAGRALAMQEAATSASNHDVDTA